MGADRRDDGLDVVRDAARSIAEKGLASPVVLECFATGIFEAGRRQGFKDAADYVERTFNRKADVLRVLRTLRGWSRRRDR